MRIVQCSTQCNQTVWRGEPPKFLPSFAKFKVFHPPTEVQCLVWHHLYCHAVVEKKMFGWKKKKMSRSLSSLHFPAPSSLKERTNISWVPRGRKGCRKVLHQIIRQWNIFQLKFIMPWRFIMIFFFLPQFLQCTYSWHGERKRLQQKHPRWSSCAEVSPRSIR